MKKTVFFQMLITQKNHFFFLIFFTNCTQVKLAFCRVPICKIASKLIYDFLSEKFNFFSKKTGQSSIEWACTQAPLSSIFFLIFLPKSRFHTWNFAANRMLISFFLELLDFFKVWWNFYFLIFFLVLIRV